MPVTYIPIDSELEESRETKRPDTAVQRESPYDDQTSFRDYSDRKALYHQIDTNLLIPGTEIDFSLFVHKDFSFEPLLRASQGAPASVPESLSALAGDIVIRNHDIPLYTEYLDAVIKAPSEPGRAKLKTVAVRENSKIVLKQLFENPRSGQLTKTSTAIVSNLVDCILENRDAIYDLLSIRNFDYYTYTHSVNVAVLSIGLGIATALPREAVERLGIGALLHDIGKSAVPVDLLNKQGRLSEVEYGILRTHVVKGEQILKGRREIPEESLPAVSQHHEKLSGRGYPRHLSGNAISFFGRVTAVADCYDALTTKRPYKPAFAPYEALSTIVRESGDYDKDLLKVFIKMLGKIEQ